MNIPYLGPNIPLHQQAQAENCYRLGQIAEGIEALWGDTPGATRFPATNWLALERVQRKILRCHRDGLLSTAEALTNLDEALAAATGRGNELAP